MSSGATFHPHRPERICSPRGSASHNPRRFPSKTGNIRLQASCSHPSRTADGATSEIHDNHRQFSARSSVQCPDGTRTDVVCPTTFVKAKVALEELDEGQVLSIKMNDGEPVQNVPRSIKEEGHKILKLINNDDGTYNLIVEKVGD